MADLTPVRVLVTGRVRGVSFRRRGQPPRGERLGRTLPDGRVEAHVEGERAAVERLIAWFRAGPPATRVDEVLVEPVPVTVVDGFQVTG